MRGAIYHLATLHERYLRPEERAAIKAGRADLLAAKLRELGIDPRAAATNPTMNYYLSSST
jgi:hypothetical protein